MKSVRNIYKIGIGPSSSHTMGPAFAAERFLLENPGVERVVVTLYGSLSKTGKGHGTDRAIIDVFEGIPTEVIFNDEDIKLEHPNTLNFKGYVGGKKIADMTVLSVGGGEIEVVGEDKHNEEKEEDSVIKPYKIAHSLKKRSNQTAKCSKCSAFFRSGFNALIKLWLENDCRESPEELYDILRQEYNLEKI